MNRQLRRAIILPALLFAVSQYVSAQTVATATRQITFSTFAGLTGTRTGLSDGRNASITFGFDLSFLPLHGFYPSLEVRSTQVLNGGSVDGQKNILAGVQVASEHGRYRPYVDLLAGRGGITYGSGYQIPESPIFYTESHGNAIAAGGGLDFKLSSHLSMRLNAEFQRYATPVMLSHRLSAEAGTIGIKYRFEFSEFRSSKRQ